jgi:hypothetical protein
MLTGDRLDEGGFDFKENFTLEGDGNDPEPGDKDNVEDDEAVDFARFDKVDKTFKAFIDKRETLFYNPTQVQK